jgi:hypothetical protein
MTTFYCLRFETPPTWRTRSPYLHPPVTGWPSYTPRHWVPFSSSSTTRRATVEVFEPASTRGKLWEERIAYFHRHYKDRVENDSSNNFSVVACVFVALVTFLPSRCLTAIGDIRVGTQTDERYLWSTALWLSQMIYVPSFIKDWFR